MTLASGKVVEAETALFAAGRRGAVEGCASKKRDWESINAATST